MSRQIIDRVRLFPLALNYLARRNPWVPVWWSVALPGFGHILMGQTVKGFILMAWEVLVNHQAHLNVAIYHSLLGHAEQAKEVVAYRWLILYPLFYGFSMFDAYRTCLDINHLEQLERLQPRRRFERTLTTFSGVVMLSRKNPALAALWSAILPGLGQLYIYRGLKALTLMGWYLAVVLLSGLADAAYHSLLGEWSEVGAHLDYQWLLFWPSIYIFGIVDAYTDAVEQNLVVDDAFRYRMRKYLRNGTK